MKRFWVVLVLACLVGQMPPHAAAHEVKLRATLQVPASEPYLGVPLVEFKELVEKRSNSAISIEIFDKGQLYIDTQVVGAVASGAIEMGVAGTYQFAKRIPEITIVEQPFLLNFDALLRAAVGPGSEMRALIDKAVLAATGVRVLWWQPAGTAVFFSKGTDLGEPHAIAGQRVRVFSEITATLTRQCGGHPAIISTSKMHDAIKDGLVDLSMGAITSVEPRGLWKVADIVTVTNHVPIEFLLLVNEKAWASLPPAHQAVIAEAARDVERRARDRAAVNEANAYAFSRSKGIQVRALTADQVAEWRACSAGMLEEYMGLGGDLSRRLLAAYAKLRTDPCCMSGPGDTTGPFNRH